MDSNTTSQDFPPAESADASQSFSSNVPQWQESAPRFRGQRPYPTSNPRMRHHGDFQSRGRYSYNKRGGGYRPQYRDKNFGQQQNQSSDNPEYQTTAINHTFNRFFRPNMLEDPWTRMTPIKVPSNGTTLVSDSTNH